MRIVVPVSGSDLDKLTKWIDVVTHLKCGDMHELTLVPTPSTASQCYDAKAALDEVFASVEVTPLPIEPIGGWPIAPNNHFWHCANIMGRDPGKPWFFCELDCLPVRQNAFDLLASQYASAGTPFFGSVDKTPWRHESGHIVPSMYGDGDVMMSGCGVYPGDMIHREGIAALMQGFMLGLESTQEPWDMYLRFEVRNAGLGHTELIGNKWNTENYRPEGLFLACDSRKTHEIFTKNPGWQIRECGGRIHPEAVLIHGCKDDSLYELIISDRIPAPVFKKKVEKAPELPSVATGSPAPSPSLPDESMRVAVLEKKLENITDMFAKFLERSANEAPQKPEVSDDEDGIPPPMPKKRGRRPKLAEIP